MTEADAAFVTAHPASALSARLFLTLEPEQQKEAIGQLIESAVYCDSWETYFAYAKKNGIPVNDDVAFEAVQAVGLDPQSAALWMTAASCCSDGEGKRELYQLALSIPLYGRAQLIDEYEAFERVSNSDYFYDDFHEEALSAVVGIEHWPDRYTDMSFPAEKEEVRQQWLVLIEAMYDNLQAEVIPADLQIRRMDLAYRQMCTQLQCDDSCWYEYAMFQLTAMEDKEAAIETVEAGLRTCGCESFALNNLLAMLCGKRYEECNMQQLPEITVVDERLAADRYFAATDGGRKEALKQLRGVGKAAAQEGVQDWKVYSQWHAIERGLVKDQKMASKVLENGMICCSASPSDATLLGNEAINYHLIQRHEREALGYAEQQVEQASQTQQTGKKRAAWNRLVSTENQLGLSFSKAELRRNEEFPQSDMQTFMERYRVGGLLPCTPETQAWLQFVDDYALEKRQEKEAPFKEMEAARSTVLCPQLALARLAAPAEPEVVDESQWQPFTAPTNSFAPSPEALAAKRDDDPDEIIGSRELRGRWAYRIKVDKQTAARVEREERLRRARTVGEDATGDGVAETAMRVLVQRTKALQLNELQKQRLKALSVDWIINQLVSAELDLREALKDRPAGQPT